MPTVATTLATVRPSRPGQRRPVEALSRMYAAHATGARGPAGPGPAAPGGGAQRDFPPPRDRREQRERHPGPVQLARLDPEQRDPGPRQRHPDQVARTPAARDGEPQGTEELDG